MYLFLLFLFEKAFEEVIFLLVPQKCLIDVKKIVDYAVFLASEKAKGITGQAAVLDGGCTAPQRWKYLTFVERHFSV